jgi:sugar/nucleoside kinase (ribokinase family)
MDVQGYLRRVDNGRIVPAVSDRLEEALRLVHVIKADEEELTLMLEHFRVSLPGFLQHFRIDEAVITRGSRGASVWTRAGEGVHFGAEQVRRPVSTVGAGDVFFAAYLASHIYRRLDIDMAATFATGLAAKQVAGKHLPPGLLDVASRHASQANRKSIARPDADEVKK